MRSRIRHFPPRPPPHPTLSAQGSFAPFRNHCRRIDSIPSRTGRSRVVVLLLVVLGNERKISEGRENDARKVLSF